MPHLIRISCISLCLILTACQTAYYGAMEKFGIEKRDILVDRVDEAKESQQEAKEQFSSALEAFSDLTEFKGGTLEKQYKTLKAEFEKSEARAEAVYERIDKVEQVSKDLFAEWKKEINLYSNSSLKTQSQNQLSETQVKYDQLIVVMRRAERRIDPVLKVFRDRVLYLKHNLNARAVSAMSTDVSEVKSDISQLIKDMNLSISEADNFIASLKSGS